MKKKKCGYFWRLNAELKAISKYKQVRGVDFCKLRPKHRRWIIRHWNDFKFWMVLIVFLACNSFAFQGNGDCSKLLTDYAQLTSKSVFLPVLLDGKCVIQSEKHFPLILKSAGFHYREKDGFIELRRIEPVPEKLKPEFEPKSIKYDVSFAFINIGNAFDCGASVDDVLATFNNLRGAFTFAGSIGCPALDYDGSFIFSVNANLVENWSYSHGQEVQRQKAQITSSTGAITNEYEWLTAGLTLTLNQTERGVFYTLRYAGNNGSITTSSGGIVPEIRATIIDEYQATRKILFVPIGKEKRLATYSLLLRITPQQPPNN